MASVFATRQIPGPALDLLLEHGHQVQVSSLDRSMTHAELLAAVPGREALLTQLSDTVDAEVMDAAGESLRVISNYAVGFNNIDVEEATRRRILVCNTPDVLTAATADLAWSLLLGVTRRVAEGDRMVRNGAFTGWAPHLLLGGDVEGKTLAIVGAGRIGQAVARRSRGWNMRVLYVSRTRRPALELELGAEHVDLSTALEKADFLSLHLPLCPDTHHLIGQDHFKAMKSTAYLINTARGPIVDERALVEALREGWIAGAGLDVYEEEPLLTPGLADLPNVLLLPHLGSATVSTRARMSELAARNILAALAGECPPHPVNS